MSRHDLPENWLNNGVGARIPIAIGALAGTIKERLAPKAAQQDLWVKILSGINQGADAIAERVAQYVQLTNGIRDDLPTSMTDSPAIDLTKWPDETTGGDGGNG